MNGGVTSCILIVPGALGAGLAIKEIALQSHARKKELESYKKEYGVKESDQTQYGFDDLFEEALTHYANAFSNIEDTIRNTLGCERDLGTEGEDYEL